uniref:Uncharacterized protein n=1 Tax=Rhizophora mucronata TaxID=61149 RepID=A0A2P2PLK5_RHIMU
MIYLRGESFNFVVYSNLVMLVTNLKKEYYY